jgi:hypothetical protein
MYVTELQKYSNRRKTGFQVNDSDGSICISTVDGAESIYLPYDVLDWIIKELNDYLDDCKLNGSISSSTFPSKQHAESGDECGIYERHLKPL